MDIVGNPLRNMFTYLIFPDLCSVKDSNTGSEISISWNGQIIKGKIVFRSHHGLKVEITSPYYGWTEATSINGFHKTSPYHFLTEYGEESAKEMLIVCFQKMRLLEQKWPTILALYKSLMSLIGQLGITLEDDQAKIIRSVIKKEWSGWIFDEPVTGLLLSYSQEDQLLEFIKRRLSIPRQ